MSIQRHVIQQQIVEITLANKDKAWELQQALSRIFQSRLPTVLDRCLSEVSTANYLQRIERLELDLGEFESDFSADEWLGRVEVSLRQALREQLEPMPELSAQSLVMRRTAHQNHKEAMESPTAPLALNADSSKLTSLASVPKVYQDHTLQSELDLLEHFIQAGYLPWWADSRQRHLPEITLINLLKTEPEALRPLLVRLIKEPRSLQRLLSYFNDDYLQIITVLLSASSEDSVIKLLSILTEGQGSIHQQLISPREEVPIHQQLISPEVQASIKSDPIDSPVLTPLPSPISQSRLKATCWQSLLQVLVTGRPAFNQHADFLLAVTLRWANLLGISQVQLNNQLQQNHLSTEAIDNEWLQAINLLALKSTESTTGTDQLTTSPQASKPPANPETLQAVTAFSDAEALYINNAGLCLLWPFLGAFFESLDLMHNNRFHDLAAQQCAVSLLHYLATEDLNPPEYQLPFNKLLCAMAISDVFEVESPLTTLQIEACDALLLAVIDHAPILNNMSVNGFRGSFLLRPGSLSASDGSWLLRVEQQTFDVVLARFPWTWQWVKLPWMEYPLRVEWSCN